MIRSSLDWHAGWTKLGHWVAGDSSREVEFHDGGIRYKATDGSIATVVLENIDLPEAAFVRISGEPRMNLTMELIGRRGNLMLRTDRVLDGRGITTLRVPNNSNDRVVGIRVSASEGSLYLREAEYRVLRAVNPTRRTLYADAVCAGIATIPSRVWMLERVIDSLLPQVDHAFVYLNGFGPCPKFLQRPDITVLRSQEFGDNRDNSKFFGLHMLAGAAYYITADDDIDYPANYIANVIAGIDRYGGKAVVGVHGVVYGAGSRHFRDRITFHFEEGLAEDMLVNVLGTGTVGFHTGTFRPDCLAFERTGMVDLVIGRSLNDLNVPAIALARPPKMLRGQLHPADAQTLFDETKVENSPHDAFIREHSWRIVGREEPVVFERLLPVAKIFAAFESALREGVCPHALAVPWNDRIPALAEHHRIRGLAVAAVRGRLACLVRQALVLLDDRDGGLSLQCPESTVRAKCLDLLRRFMGGIHQIELQEEQLESGFSNDPAMNTEWLAPAVAVADAELLCVHAVLMVLQEPSSERMHALVRAASRAYEMDLADAAVEHIRRSGRVHDDDLVEHALGLLKSGQQERVLDDASDLVASGRLGQLFLAMAALSCGYPWAQDLTEEVLLNVRPKGPMLRRLRDLTAALRNTGGDVIDAKRFAEILPLVPSVLTKDIASVLLAASYWDELFNVDRLQLDAGLERDLWLARIRQVRDPDALHSLHALNRAFLAQRMLPVQLEGESGGFFHRLGPALRTRASSGGPLVTVIMAAFNAEETIRYALRSVLDQSYPNIEVVVVDDASESPLELGWAQHSDIPVTLVRLKDNAGPYVCRNIAISRARGDFIATHDADDWMHPQKIERQVALIVETGSVAAYSRHVRLDERGIVAFENNGLFVGDGPITSMFRKSVVDRIGGFRDVRTRGDVEFKARMVNAYGATSIFHEEDVTLLALDSANSNSKRSLKSWKDEVDLTQFKLKYAVDNPLRSLRPYNRLPGLDIR